MIPNYTVKVFTKSRETFEFFLTCKKNKDKIPLIIRDQLGENTMISNAPTKEEIKEQLEALKKEIYSTLGTVNQQKMIHGFQAGDKMEQYKIICSVPGRTDDILDYIGYPVQIRIGSGAFGSDEVIFRKADGNLVVWENQSFLALTKEQHDLVLPLFADLINEDKLNDSGYSISGGDKKIGFYVDGSQNRHSSNTTTCITVKGKNGKIKEQTIILD